MNNKAFIFMFLFGAAIISISASTLWNKSGTFTLRGKDYSTCVIVCAQDNIIAAFAATELQKHLALVTGITIPIEKSQANAKKAFYVGIIPASDKLPLGTEEARYIVTTRAVYLYGEDNVTFKGDSPAIAAADLTRNRVGTLFAVYNFLENELGIHWYEPGDQGIVYEARNTVAIPVKSDSWSSHFTYMRRMRSYTWNYDSFVRDENAIPEEFRLTREQVEAKRLETDIWLRRMRMGSKSPDLPFGHSFTWWWEKYGNDHPEWFALNGSGFRGPMGEADRIKMCPSNNSLVEKIVDLYLEKEGGHRGGGGIDGTENDGGGNGVAEYCHCDACLALDHLLPGEKFGANLTDRYVNFWHRIADLALKQDPAVVVTGFAYAEMLKPPRIERLHEKMVISFVPKFNDDFSYTASLYKGWTDMGMKNMIYRPNDLCCDLGLPMGQEKRVFDHQQLAIQYNTVGTDHDALYGFWTGISGVNYYILAKAHVDPSKPFEYWEKEYYGMFGKARDDIREFHLYWREEVFNKRLYPADQEKRAGGDADGLLGWAICGAYGREAGKYYQTVDFDITDGFLLSAMNKELSPLQKGLVERLIIANKHNRLSFLAMIAGRQQDGQDKVKASKELLDYRLTHKDDLYMNWPLLFSVQQGLYGDICGMGNLKSLGRKKEFDCRTFAHPPEIDGNLDDACWKNAGTGTPFLAMPDGNDPLEQTITFTGYDKEALYIAFKCIEPKTGLLKETAAVRDGEVWSDNAVELFFDPVKTGTDYYQVIISSKGVLFDGAMQGGKYSEAFNLEGGSGITYAISKGVDYWTAEIRITFAALNMTAPEPGSSIRFNLCRDRALSDGIGNESTSLAALFSHFQNPGRFVTLTFY